MMEAEAGNKEFPIWLLGDSNPKAWEDRLSVPLDPRHPIRHNIWTSVLDVIQDRVFRVRRARVDTERIYVRNAIENPDNKPQEGDVEWTGKVAEEVRNFRNLVREHSPKLILCFGAFSFEFAKRAVDQVQGRAYGSWDTKALGAEFVTRVEGFDPATTNVLPLLHRSISGGRFLQSHKYFCNKDGANYFDFVGQGIACKLLTHYDQLKVWVDQKGM